MKQKRWVGPLVLAIAGLYLLLRSVTRSDEEPRPGRLTPLTERTIELGRVAEGADVELQVLLLNEGDLPVRVRRLHTTCGCTIARADKTTVVGGDTLELQVNVDTRSLGPQSADVLLDLDGSSATLVAARVSFVVAPPMESLPRSPHVEWRASTPAEDQLFGIEFYLHEGEIPALLTSEVDRPGIVTRWDATSSRATLWLKPDFALLDRGSYYAVVSLAFEDPRLDLKKAVLLNVDGARVTLHPTALVACATEVERRFTVRGRLDWDGASVDPLSVEPFRFEAQIEARTSEPGPEFELDLLLPRAPSLSQRVELRLVTHRGAFIAPLLIPAAFSGDPAKLGGQLAPAQR